MNIKHRCMRKVKSRESRERVEYHVQRRLRYLPFWITTVVFKDLKLALGALKRARKNGHSEIIEEGDCMVVNWFDMYHSSPRLSKEEREFLSNFTEDEFISCLPYDFTVNAIRKMSVVDAVKSVMRYNEKGEWLYFGENSYLNNCHLKCSVYGRKL